MNSSVSGFIYESKQKLLESPELQKRILEAASFLEMVENHQHNYKVSIINLERELEGFYNNINFTNVTKKLYRRWLQHFLSWCNANKIDCLKLIREEAGKYIKYLSTEEYKPGKRYSTGSINSIVMCVLILQGIKRTKSIYHND
jgi:ERCC4-type nuclease